MRIVTPFLILAILFTSCGNHTTYVDHVSTTYYPGHEDKFGFLVLDKERVDSFFLQYPDLSFRNEKLQKAFKALLRVDTNFKRGDDRFTRHISPPISFDKQLAMELLQSTVMQQQADNFPGSLNYLFFYKCLPDVFKANWPQVQLGDLQFNVTFSIYLEPGARCLKTTLSWSPYIGMKILKRFLAKRSIMNSPSTKCN
ncbi:hypothetical protein [Paraflavitalea speifideaquila]|uniref:hypothetical protein n=1 Tax=Paraflavitalea speifideaquila TaxID=3076558 RepID=UPI0028E913C8|nr:hypothetical protein [Paraflavitalea speifideiaquila]